jgi:hypothetical protein
VRAADDPGAVVGAGTRRVPGRADADGASHRACARRSRTGARRCATRSRCSRWALSCR